MIAVHEFAAHKTKWGIHYYGRIMRIIDWMCKPRRKPLHHALVDSKVNAVMDLTYALGGVLGPLSAVREAVEQEDWTEARKQMWIAAGLKNTQYEQD